MLYSRDRVPRCPHYYAAGSRSRSHRLTLESAAKVGTPSLAGTRSIARSQNPRKSRRWYDRRSKSGWISLPMTKLIIPTKFGCCHADLACDAPLPSGQNRIQAEEQRQEKRNYSGDYQKEAGLSSWGTDQIALKLNRRHRLSGPARRRMRRPSCRPVRSSMTRGSCGMRRWKGTRHQELLRQG